MAIRYTNLDINQGATYQITVSVASASGIPVDLSSASISAQIRTDYDVNPIITSFDVQITDTANGVFTLTLYPSQSILLSTRKYVYDCIALESGSGGVVNEYKLLQGTVFVFPLVTK